MWTWIAANIGSIIVVFVLIAIVAAIVVKMIRDRKRGKSSCGCGCAGCTFKGSCRNGANTARTEKKTK